MAPNGGRGCGGWCIRRMEGMPGSMVWHVTRFRPIGKRIWVGWNNTLQWYPFMAWAKVMLPVLHHRILIKIGFGEREKLSEKLELLLTPLAFFPSQFQTSRVHHTLMMYAQIWIILKGSPDIGGCRCCCSEGLQGRTVPSSPPLYTKSGSR